MFANIVNGFKEKIRQYIDVKIRLLKLDLIGHAANLMSTIIFMLICLFIFFCILLFIGFGLVEVFSDLGLSRTASFFITTGIYFLFLFGALLSRKSITGFFAGAIIRGMTGGEDEEKPME